MVQLVADFFFLRFAVLPQEGLRSRVHDLYSLLYPPPALRSLCRAPGKDFILPALPPCSVSALLLAGPVPLLSLCLSPLSTDPWGWASGFLFT